MEELRWLVLPAHFSAPIAYGPDDIRAFLAGLGARLVELGLVPDDPEGGGSGR